jgi:putative ABC transport system ATP-binding protein/lipoprotein-releasing system ATP-binding protein
MLTATGVGYVLPDGRSLFDGVSLSLRPGEALAVEGPSGTGKSTLLGILGGVLTPTAGQVEHRTGRRPPFAWVLQTLNSLAARTVHDNAALLSLLDGEPRTDAYERAARVLADLGLGERLRSRARNLSGGELQRVAVARAISSVRPIVLADEPTNQLDRDLARHVMAALIRSAKKDNRIVVIVTHDHDALPASCRVARLGPEGLTELPGTGTRGPDEGGLR